MGPIRTGLIGAGRLGVALGRDVRTNPDTQLVGIADVDGETLNEAGERLDVDASARFRDHEAMFERVDLDAHAADVVLAVGRSSRATSTRANVVRRDRCRQDPRSVTSGRRPSHR